MTRYRLVACSDGPLSDSYIHSAMSFCLEVTTRKAFEAALKGAADDKARWIHVVERYPEPFNRVPVLLENADVEGREYAQTYAYHDCKVWFGANGGLQGVFAWYDLPPYIDVAKGEV